ncbi:MAG TPA: PEP-CTERM sorting domain-containing protein [Lacipirellulaceae bacterium]|nr:PEP-CTERM sorting domain-containing protein [Lacipirellulaceae bacterium]
MTRQFLLSAAILFTSLCTATTAVNAAPIITNLGSLPGGIETGPSGVSADGTTVVGVAETSTGNLRAFRWTTSTGVQELGPSDPAVNSFSQGVSSNGSVVVGATYGGSSGQNGAFRWTSATGMQDLGLLSGGISALANGVSSDGSVVVGGASTSSNVSLSFRWTAATGMQALPVQSGFASGSASGVSADGSVTVGYSTPSGSDGYRGDRAYRYTTAGGYQNLGVLPGSDRSYANGVSGDGNTVIGGSQLLPVFFEPSQIRATRWTAAGGLQDISLPGDISAGASAASFDGSRIVGSSGERAFLWTSTLGSVDLNTYLPTLGLDLTGWHLVIATAISADGSVIAGAGEFNGEQAGWIVSGIAVPEPSTLLIVALGGIALIAAPSRMHSRR